MPLGRVADDGDGVRFFAHVEFDEPGPFSFVQGPEDVGAAEAVGWARSHARRVIIRIGGTHYSAGEEPVAGLAPWDGEPVERERAPGEPVAWRVVAGTGWYRSDRADVARALAAGVEGNQRAGRVASVVTEVGFDVAFTVVAASEVEANELASAIMRAAWAATGIVAAPGDFDAAGVTLTRA
jgi:hypothetical protein